MPLADVAHLITRITEGFTEAFRCGFELATVAEHAVVVSELSAHQGSAIRTADRRGGDAGIEAKALGSELIECRGLRAGIAITAHREGALHIGDDVEDI